MEETIVMPTVRKYNDIGKTEIMFQLSKAPGKAFPFYPPTETIPAQSEILFIPEKLDANGKGTGEGDMEKAYNRLIAYIPGMRSIYVDEWSDKEKEKLKELKSIKFIIGFKTISTRERTLLAYLRMAGYNQANEDTRISPAVLYKEVDYEAEAKKVVEHDNKLINAQYFVNNNPIDEVRAYAEALCKTQGEVESVRKQDEYTVRYKLREIARTTPDVFTKGLTDPVMKNRLFIVRALQKGIIKCNEKDTELSWANNGKVFIEAPSGMTVIPYFAELSSKNDKYKEMLESVKALLNENKTEEGTEVLDWVDVFIKQAVKASALVQSANWYLVPGATDEDEPAFKYNGHKKLRAAIESNEDNIMAVISIKMKSLE